MTVQAVAAAHYRLQAGLAASTVARARAAWREVDSADLDGSWGRVSERMFVLLSAAQLSAASVAEPYVANALAEQNVEAEPEGSVEPRAFVGASDGRDMEALLQGPVATVKYGIGSGHEVAVAMGMGEAALVRIVATQVQDAGRAAVGVGIAARPRVGWARMLNPPSCSRCAILAGRVYRWNTGFQRHPMCDCTHIPAAENTASDLTTNPRAYFNSLTESEQARYFTKAGAKAIRDGADMGRVVNARRGMSTAQTASGRRVLARRNGVFVTAGGRRLMPESIYEMAADRAEAVELLRANGFLT